MRDYIVGLIEEVRRDLSNAEDFKKELEDKSKDNDDNILKLQGALIALQNVLMYIERESDNGDSEG